MNVTDATAKTAMLKAAMNRAKTNADKHKEVRARRFELRSLQSEDDVQVGHLRRKLVATCDECTTQRSWHR